jgi:hypothetical protein
MAFQINGVEVISNSSNIENMESLAPGEPTGFLRQEFGYGKWTGSNSYSFSNNSAVINLRTGAGGSGAIWPSSNNFREAVWEMRCTAIASGSHTFNSDATWHFGDPSASSSGFAPANCMCKSTTWIKVNHAIYIHVMNTYDYKINNKPFFVARAWVNKNQNVSYNEDLLQSSAKSTYDPGSLMGENCWDESIESASDTNKILLTFPAMSASTYTWRTQCWFR